MQELRKRFQEETGTSLDDLGFDAKYTTWLENLLNEYEELGRLLAKPLKHLTKDEVKRLSYLQQKSS